MSLTETLRSAASESYRLHVELDVLAGKNEALEDLNKKNVEKIITLEAEIDRLRQELVNHANA